MLVTAVIVNWNRYEDTRACILSLLHQQPQPPNIVIIDNRSTDGSTQKLVDTYPEIRIIENTKNEYYAKAANIGIKAAIEEESTHILLLNNDTIAPSNLISTLLENYDDQTGIVAPIIYYHDNQSLIWSAGGKTIPLIHETTNILRDEIAPPDLPEIIDQDFVNGCCMLVSKDIFYEVGLLDHENFPMYYDDADFCFRLINAGKKIKVITTSHLVHKVASSSGKNTKFERYWMARGSLVYIRKHLKFPRNVLPILWRLGSFVKTSLMLLFSGNKKVITSLTKGIVDGLTMKIK